MLLYDIAVAALLAYAALGNGLYGVVVLAGRGSSHADECLCVACLRHSSLFLGPSHLAEHAHAKRQPQ